MSSTDTWGISPKIETPALFTQVSNRPNSATAAAATAATSCWRPTSATTGSAWPPDRRISLASSCRACSFRAARTTFAPRCAAHRAVTRPMPLEAPVMTTTCWSSGRRDKDTGCSRMRTGGPGEGAGTGHRWWPAQHGACRHLPGPEGDSAPPVQRAGDQVGGDHVTAGELLVGDVVAVRLQLRGDPPAAAGDREHPVVGAVADPDPWPPVPPGRGQEARGEGEDRLGEVAVGHPQGQRVRAAVGEAGQRD